MYRSQNATRPGPVGLTLMLKTRARARAEARARVAALLVLRVRTCLGSAGQSSPAHSSRARAPACARLVLTPVPSTSARSPDSAASLEIPVTKRNTSNCTLAPAAGSGIFIPGDHPFARLPRIACHASAVVSSPCRTEPACTGRGSFPSRREHRFHLSPDRLIASGFRRRDRPLETVRFPTVKFLPPPSP